MEENNRIDRRSDLGCLLIRRRSEGPTGPRAIVSHNDNSQSHTLTSHGNRPPLLHCPMEGRELLERAAEVCMSYKRGDLVEVTVRTASDPGGELKLWGASLDDTAGPRLRIAIVVIDNGNNIRKVTEINRSPRCRSTSGRNCRTADTSNAVTAANRS